MKNNFDNLILKYLSLYNENEEHQKTCKACGSDLNMDENGEKCVNCNTEDNESAYDSDEVMHGHEDYESEEGDHYRNDEDSPRKNYGHSFKDGDYPDDVDYKDDDFNKSGDCPECGEEGCVDKNGHCHYCNPEDDEMESGKEYGEDELPPPPPVTRPTVY